MMQPMMNLFLLISSFIFSQLKHPLTMGFLLLIQTILICSITGMMYKSFWFSYTLFLVFLGGMLVLFIYIISLASNEMLNFSFKLLWYMIMYIIIIIMLMLLIDKMEITFINNLEISHIKFNNFFSENYQSIFKLYNYPTNWLTILLMNYLLFTLIVVVKVTNFFYGPIRNLN